MSKEEEEEGEEEERGAEEEAMFGCSTQTTRLELLVIGLGRLFNGDMENFRSFTSLEYKCTHTQYNNRILLSSAHNIKLYDVRPCIVLMVDTY